LSCHSMCLCSLLVCLVQLSPRLPIRLRKILFLFNDPAPTEIYTLSLHDALPILSYVYSFFRWTGVGPLDNFIGFNNYLQLFQDKDRKSTRLNSSHVSISYAVFCLKKKKILIRR